MAKTTNTATKETKEYKMKQVFALWKSESKAGTTYFEGKYEGDAIRGFYNTQKKNPNEPDLRVYALDGEGKLCKEELLSLWCNATESGKKYLSGKFGGKRVVGFINTKATAENKQPYISIYWSEDRVEQETKKEEVKTVKEPF